MNSKFAAALAGIAFLATAATAEEPAFPLASIVAEARPAAMAAKPAPSGLRRQDYLESSEGIVAYFGHFQTADGRILDPFLDKEVQYSTPCYAWAASALISSGRQTNLLDSASRALDASLLELSSGHAADNHGDFFTFPSMLAYEVLRGRVSNERRKVWEKELRAIAPERVYQDIPEKRVPHNWAVVALAGEYLRQQDGFCDSSFVEKALGPQLKNFTPNGQYLDPGTPMAYDGFPRAFLAAMVERGYRGADYDTLTNLLDRGAWTSLLIQSPCGEWPAGGRSAQHQWNEAMQCMTCEIWARRKQREGDAADAQMFKGAAHLALESIRRWARPSGDLWIVKNRFDPAVRHGFQNYSTHSQYNLLAASMLCAAWLFADDEIPEAACPAQTGGFAFELPNFHKVIANAGGLYVELETGAAPEFNSTGLIRVHRSGVDPLVGPSDSSAINDGPGAVGIAWREGDRWRSLASLGQKQIQRTEFSTGENKPDHVRFTVRYVLSRKDVAAVTETYDLTPGRAQVTAQVEGNVPEVEARFPAMAFDGASASQITLSGSSATVRMNQSQEVFSVESPPDAKLARSGSWTSCRNGFFEMIESIVPGNRVVYTLTPSARP